jgi:hypothetical protein
LLLRYDISLSMGQRIYSYYPLRGKIQTVGLFSYTTRGVPGLEIIGLPSWGKLVREKFIFMTRLQEKKIPLKRYVLCVGDEFAVKDTEAANGSWLELPLLLLFWTMAEILPIKKLDDCLCSGRLSVRGEITSFNLPSEIMKKIYFQVGKKINLTPKLFAINSPVIPGICHFPLEEVFFGLKGLSFPQKFYRVISLTANHSEELGSMNFRSVTAKAIGQSVKC